MAQGLFLSQTSYNGTDVTNSIALNTSRVFNVVAEGTGCRILYKNLDGSMTAIIVGGQTAAAVLTAMNANLGSYMNMITLTLASGGNVYVPVASVYVGLELSNGNTQVLYATSANDSLIEVEVTESAAGIVNKMNDD
tara:strand:+ start:948 stop:1358 length:411 start_codon:yes stop_codon:yes gene_type:complete